MNRSAAALAEATVQQQCTMLRLSAIGSQCVRLAEQAMRQQRTNLGYREVLLAAEWEKREQNTVERRSRETRLPRMKTLEEFDFSQSPKVSAAEWTQVIPNARLCKALLNRSTDRAHIIETGTESCRFRRAMQRKRKP